MSKDALCGVGFYLLCIMLFLFLFLGLTSKYTFILSNNQTNMSIWPFEMCTCNRDSQCFQKPEHLVNRCPYKGGRKHATPVLVKKKTQRSEWCTCIDTQTSTQLDIGTICQIHHRKSLTDRSILFVV